MASRDDAEAYYLDRDHEREAAAADPTGFVAHDGLLMIDEIQRAPELLLVGRRIADDLAISEATVRRYVAALEMVYAIHRVPAWSNKLTTRATSTPKIIFVDSGLVGHLTGMDLRRASHPTANVGPLIENFVLGELARQLTWAEEPVSLHHYRDRDGNEVDAVLERASGEIVGVEVKASETVRAGDFRGLRRLADQVGDRFRAGYVLYSGSAVLSFGPRLRAAPISALWTTGAAPATPPA